MSVKDKRVLTFKTPEDMLEVLEDKGKSLKSFKKGTTVNVWNKMEKGYEYTLDESPGKNFNSEFKPWASPGKMLELGVFEGKYLNDCVLEFPSEWFSNAIKKGKLCPTNPTKEINLLKADSRQPLSEWKRKGWVSGHSKSDPVLSNSETNPDERGWFQWYCRYWLGRRIPELDQVQIKRWKAFKRHAGQITANCDSGDMSCRPRQRQALLQWAWNPRI
jgi:hypothetical protein